MFVNIPLYCTVYHANLFFSNGPLLWPIIQTLRPIEAAQILSHDSGWFSELLVTICYVVDVVIKNVFFSSLKYLLTRAGFFLPNCEIFPGIFPRVFYV